ncbi:hypothetical protein SISNIDRAFT_48484 [Sistotremastrum niveocremeum HHB9708]|uniref:Uncharacterized protein n=1 Tax=Sistotremastrum niveocremeum HHB9708 TaxID=1314777 RepID=A0A164VX09_9AGAM|nr:hypothetical protein SISNIDRAFT_48484 [Sistotremastrum niveocremeum HHB9708]
MARPGTGFGWNPNIYEQPGYNGPPAGYPEQAYPPGVADPQAHAPYPQANVSQPQPQPQQQPQPQPNTFPRPASQNPNGYPQQSYQAPSQPAPAQQQVPQPQPVQAAQPAAAQPLPEFQSGPPPYIYNPNGRYDDKGAQDWAQFVSYPV